MNEVFRPTREERKQSEALDSLNGPVGIRNGAQVSNFAVDQNLVISYLNKIPVENGGTLSPSGPTHFKATRNGFCDPSLAKSIRKFQQVNGLGSDGVVDPGGPTLRALKASAAGAHSNTAPNQNAKEQEFINKVFSLIGLLRLLINKRPNILTDAQLGQTRILLLDLELIMAKSGAKPTSQQLPVQNNAVAIPIIVGIIALGVAIILLSQDPTWRKAAKIMSDGIVEGVTGRARRLNQLLQEAQDATVRTLVDGVVKINDKAFELTKKRQICQPKFAEFERIATKLTFDLFHRPALVSQAIEAFINALVKLLECLGVDGLPLLKLLQEGRQAGQTLFDLLVKASGGKFQLPSLSR